MWGRCLSMHSSSLSLPTLSAAPLILPLSYLPVYSFHQGSLATGPCRSWSTNEHYRWPTTASPQGRSSPFHFRGVLYFLTMFYINLIYVYIGKTKQKHQSGLLMHATLFHFVLLRLCPHKRHELYFASSATCFPLYIRMSFPTHRKREEWRGWEGERVRETRLRTWWIGPRVVYIGISTCLLIYIYIYAGSWYVCSPASICLSFLANNFTTFQSSTKPWRACVKRAYLRLRPA